MTKGILIGLTGHAGHGKSSVADYLVAVHGFIKMSFADELKSMLHRVDPIIAFEHGAVVRLSDAFDMTGGDELLVKNLYPEYRRSMQALGTDGIRTVSGNFWVDLMEERIEAQFKSDPSSYIVVDDVRFPNEAGLFDPEWNPDASLWNVFRPGEEQNTEHESEQWAGKLGESLFISNRTTLKNLHNSVDEALLGISYPGLTASQ